MKEIEFKYSADAADISLKQFKIFCSKYMPYTKVEEVEGTDMFFGNKDKDTTFFRYRLGDDFTQLTFKKKIVEVDSFIRDEYNLTLIGRPTIPAVTKFLGELGYKPKGTLYKTSCVYISDFFLVAYYTCYKDEQRLGSFIEIELNDEKDWPDNENALYFLNTLEKDFEKLGLLPENRIKLNLYELFIKDSP